jgi:hypothetical protein
MWPGATLLIALARAFARAIALAFALAIARAFALTHLILSQRRRRRHGHWLGRRPPSLRHEHWLCHPERRTQRLEPSAQQA